MKTCALDIETQPFDPKAGIHLLNTRFICGAIADETGQRYFESIRVMEDALRAYDKIYIHNSSFDLQIFKNEDVSFYRPDRVHDTMIMAWLLDENNPIGLGDVSERYLNKKKIEFFKRGKVPLVGDPETQEYVKQDAQLCYELGELFTIMLKEQGLTQLFESIDMPFRRLMDDMTSEGIQIDLPRIEKEIERVSAKTKTIELKYLEKGINVNSCKQVSKVLYYFPEMVKKQKDGKPKTDEKTLSQIDPQLLRPEAAEIMEYRKDTKTLNTFLEGLKNAVLPETGLVHPLYNITVARTGRTSSGGSKKSYPYSFNIQNVSRKNKEVRSSVIAKPGTSMIIMDAKELELRVLAHYSEDVNLLRVFNEGIDAHVSTASLLFNKPMSEVTKAERSTAKTLNYAVLYGTTAYGLTYSLGLNETRAAHLMDAFYKAYPSIKELKNEVNKRFLLDGYVQSLYGRKRRGDINEKEVFSAYISGTSADLMKECHINASKELPREYRPFVFVHDEYGYYVPDEGAEQAKIAIQSSYERGHRDYRVPILFTAEIRKTWWKE